MEKAFQVEIISSCFIMLCRRYRPHLAKTSFQVAVEHDKVFFKPLFFLGLTTPVSSVAPHKTHASGPFPALLPFSSASLDASCTLQTRLLYKVPSS